MTFTNVGKPYTEGQEERFAAMCGEMQWLEIPRDGSRLELGAMPAMAIKAAIRQYGLVNVSQVAVSQALAPYALLGIRCHRPDSPFDLFLIDAGDEAVVVYHTSVEDQPCGQ